MSNKVTIAGAGLAGSLLTVMLAERGFEVDLIERRPDMRKVDISAGRSINLALSNRGLRALREVGIEEEVMKEVVPMKGRLVHDLQGNLDMQPYSGRDGNVINSVSRGDLNKLLLDKAETYPQVNIRFNTRLDKLNYINKTYSLRDQNDLTVVEDDPFNVLIGSDGAGSSVRLSYQLGGVPRFSFSQQFLDHGYKELEIPAGPGGTYRIDGESLHIWPRHDFMMIALPNFDGSFTVTLFQKFKGENGFDEIWNEDQLMAFFKKDFPDLIEHMPNLVDDYFRNPTGNLATVKCHPWNHDGDACLIGDAAHAVVPFYGQGMNASFEDCRVLVEKIDENMAGGNAPDWEVIFAEFFKERKADGDAIGDLAIDNYMEMRSHTANPLHKMKRELELKIEKEHKDFDSKYSLVTFRDDIGYSQAKSQGEIQDKALLEICMWADSVDQINANDAYNKLQEILKSQQ